MAEGVNIPAIDGVANVGALSSDSVSECKMTGRKSSIRNQNSSGHTKKTTTVTTKKPCNPRKCNSSGKSEAATELSDDIVRTTLDHTPATLSVNAIQSKFPDHISDKHLRQHFSNFEKYILHAVILKSTKGKYYGLITFSSSDIAETARKGFRNQLLLGCPTHLSYYEYHTIPKDQIRSEVARCVPSKTDSRSTASVGVEQCSTKGLHQALEHEPAVTLGDSPSGNSTLCVEGIHSKLPDKIGDDELMKHFCVFGNDIISASIVRNPQTRLSAGYGIITFKSPAIAKKAQKKYNGTHLCKKYQLRVTLNKDLASSTRSDSSAKVSENTEVLSSSNDRRLSESNLAALTKKRESQKTCDSSASNSSFAVSDSKDVLSLKDKETPDGLVVENLSCVVEESELKALVSGCGANVSSCVILHSPCQVALDTCVANITLVDSSQLSDVIKQLNGKEVYRRKLRVYANDKKPLLHVEERKISFALFEFITKNSHSQIKIFEEKGGVFTYQEPKHCALISAPEEIVTTEFLLQVFNGYSEKVFHFKPSQWNQLMLNADKYTPSLLNRAGSKFRAEVDAHIIPQIDKHEILFIGTCEEVARTSSWLMDQLTREFGIERDKMEALIEIYPTLNSELSDKYHIKVLNYSKRSTVIEFDGDTADVQKAHKEIEALISNFCIAEVSFEHSSFLLDTAQKRITENDFKVFIKKPTAASRSNPISLTVISFCPKHLDRATAVLKGRPTYKSLKIPSGIYTDTAKLKRIQTDVRKTFQVSIFPKYKQKACSSLVICSFVKKDVTDAHNELQEQLFNTSVVEDSVRPEPTPKGVQKRVASNSGRLRASATEECVLKPSSKHCISVKKQSVSESCCRALITLSTEMTFYAQNRVDWFKDIAKSCVSVKYPEKANFTSSDSSGHTYTFEGKIAVVDKVISEIHSLAQIFCVKVVKLRLPTENVRLMQSRWTEFKKESEAVYGVCIHFTLKSPNLHLTSKGESIITFILCASNSERLEDATQDLQTKENGLNLPVRETKLSEHQIVVLNSLIAEHSEQQLNEKHKVIMKILPETQSLILKAASKRNLDQAFKNIFILLESSMPSRSKKEVVIVEHKASKDSQGLSLCQPTSIKHCSLLFDPHYIPLFFSQAFVETVSQFEKAHDVRVIHTPESLIHSTIKQVIYRSSDGHLITVQLCYSNLIYERVDAIVNCSRKLSPSVKAIGGEAIQLELDTHIALHRAKADPVCACLESGNLPCNKIIHVVSPLQDEVRPNDFSFIQRALECAQMHRLRLISFPFASEEVVAAETFVYNLQKFFIQNPDSSIHMVRIVCSSQKLVNVCNCIEDFNGKDAVVDLPKLSAIKSPSKKYSNQAECQWYWKADNGTFIPYSEDINSILISYYKRCATGRCYFQVGSSSYIANFERMEQSNMTTHFVRDMKVEHMIQKVSDACRGKPGLSVSVKWYHHAQDKKYSRYSASDSASIEKLYFSSAESHTLRVNSEKFLFDFKAMQKLAVQQPKALPYDKICIQRKVVVHQLAKTPTQSSPQWYYMDDTKQFSPYSKHDSAYIEGMYQNGAARTLSIQSKVYTFDFNDMNQINVATQHKQSIKRVPKSSVDLHSQNHLVPLHHICKGIVISVEGSSPGLQIQEISDKLKVQVDSIVHTNELPLPVFITSSVDSKARILKAAKKHNVHCEIISKATDVDSKVLKFCGSESIIGKAIQDVMEEIVTCNPTATAVELPPEWQPQTKNTELFELPKSSNEYSHVESMFHSTMSKISTTIISIKRIQNNWLWEKYVMTRNRMSRKNNGKINERELFHGSRKCRAHNIYDSEEGFDMRYSSEGMWGQANYFAENASYSNSYAYELTDGSREILLAKVLTGDSCKCASDRSLRLPPLKGVQTRFQQERYDTVEGETGGSKVFMTYLNDKAYPAYLIVYNPNNETMWRSSPRQASTAQTSASAASWSYNLNPASSAPSSSTSANAAAPPVVNPIPSYQGRSHHARNVPPRPTPSRVPPKVTHPPQSDQKGCILQ